MSDGEELVVFCLVEEWCDVCVLVVGEYVVMVEMDDEGLGEWPKLQ